MNSCRLCLSRSALPEDQEIGSVCGRRGSKTRKRKHNANVVYMSRMLGRQIDIGFFFNSSCMCCAHSYRKRSYYRADTTTKKLDLCAEGGGARKGRGSTSGRRSRGEGQVGEVG
jgi:hypothetical protein